MCEIKTLTQIHKTNSSAMKIRIIILFLFINFIKLIISRHTSDFQQVYLMKELSKAEYYYLQALPYYLKA